MEPRNSIFKPHFHIQWPAKDRMDWESFDTHAKAEARALELSGIGERFKIVEFSAKCPICGPHAASAS
jgi:hypothetical protein